MYKLASSPNVPSGVPSAPVHCCIFFLDYYFDTSVDAPILNVWWQFDEPLTEFDVRFVHIIDENGEQYREKFIDAIAQYQARYEGNEKVLYILQYLLDAIALPEVIHPNILLIIADDM